MEKNIKIELIIAYNLDYIIKERKDKNEGENSIFG